MVRIKKEDMTHDILIVTDLSAEQNVTCMKAVYVLRLS